MLDLSRAPNTILGRKYGRVLDFSFGGRTENGHEMVLEMVSGVDFETVLHHLSSLTWLRGSWGQVWQENGPKPKLKFIYFSFLMCYSEYNRQVGSLESSALKDPVADPAGRHLLTRQPRCSSSEPPALKAPWE